MAKAEKGVFDTGPFLHLYEIGALDAVEIVKAKFICKEVEQELDQYSVPLEHIKNINRLILTLQYKNIAKIITEQWELDLGEAASIALAQQEKIRLFFTDDLEAREIAKKFRLEVHGSLGLLLRAFREKLLSKDEVMIHVKKLSTESSLFLTSDLVDWIIKEIRLYKK